MESMVLSGFVIMLVIGVLVNVWHMVVRLMTSVFFLATGVIVIGFLFGGAEAFSSAGAATEWVSILDILLGDGVGERVVGAITTFINSTIESWKRL